MKKEMRIQQGCLLAEVPNSVFGEFGYTCVDWLISHLPP
jgi:hypothetical protein